MKNIIIAILFLMTVGMCNTLVPSSIVNEIHRLESVKRHKIDSVLFLRFKRENYGKQK